MHTSSAAFILILAVSGATYGQPAPAAAPPPAGSPAPQSGPSQPTGSGSPQPPGGAPAPINTPSSLLRPSLAGVQDTLNNIRIDKWKKGSVRDEAGDHVNSLLRDLQNNLPPLITAADAAPASVSQAIPLTKHLDAFYAVLLRVEEAARVSAPSEQISSLQQSLLQLNQARLALDNQLEAHAAAQEKQIVDLQASLKTQQQALAQAKAAAAAAPPPPCKPVPPPKKKPAAKKPATNAPAATTPGTTTPAKPAPANNAPATTPAKPSAAQPQGTTGQKPPQ